MRLKLTTGLAFSASALAIAMAAGAANAQEADEVVEVAVLQEDNEARQETIIVTGARGRPRTVQESAVPVDVIGEEDIQAVSFIDTADVVRTLVPSFSLNRAPIADGATFIRPATLRGLPSDKTLVLVNSKRRHRAALVGIGGSGTQGPDLATIPSTAIGSVEVLRDGAAAQYGSDAIAGVFNFLLRENSEGIEISAQAGQYYEGDGEDYRIAGNIGMPLTEQGFINISFETSASQPTSRSIEYNLFDFDAWLAANPQLPPGTFRSPAQPWGQPEAEATRIFVNAGIDYDNGSRLYAFGNWSGSESRGNFFYRTPTNAINNPQIRREDGSLFRFRDRFPGGFLPYFSGHVIDQSLVGGYKGELANGLTYDFYGRYGKSKVAYTMEDTVNPSLGPLSPNTFRPSDLVSDEIGIGAEFSQEFEIGTASPLVVSFGGEFRDESYEIVAGDVNSWIAGPYSSPDPWNFCTNEADITLRTPTAAGAGIAGLNCASASDPVYTVLGVGSNGFPGTSPEYASDVSRDSYGVFVDLATDITDKFFVNGALRFEDYSDFGTTVDGKLAARYEINENFAIRGSVGTGFRAPTPGQLSTTNVSTRIAADGTPIASGLFPATNPVSVFLGAEPLEPEKSINYSLGFTANLLDNLTLTIDLYRIDLDDQFFAATPITVTDALRAQLIAANVPGADTIGQVQFFQNSFKSITQGIDVVATYSKDWGAYGDTAFIFSMNANTYEIDEVFNPGLFDAEGIFDFENSDPAFKGNVTASHNVGDWNVVARANFWGPYENANNATLSAIQEFGSEVFIDLEATYTIADKYRISGGVRNLFNEFPDAGSAAVGETCCGRIYRSDSQVDWQGGYYYLRVAAEF